MPSRRPLSCSASPTRQVIASLSAIQKALDNAGTRHDEQLAYYVARHGK